MRERRLAVTQLVFGMMGQRVLGFCSYLRRASESSCWLWFCQGMCRFGWDIEYVCMRENTYFDVFFFFQTMWFHIFALFYYSILLKCIFSFRFIFIFQFHYLHKKLMYLNYVNYVLNHKNATR